MKKAILWLVLLLMSATLQLCTDESETLAPEKVQFTVTIPAGNDAGRIQATELPTSLLLSLETSTGVSVFSFKEIKLFRVGASFITEPLELTQGSYKITDFLLVADSSRVLYATPKAGTPLAKAVASSLPYNFYVTKNKVSNVAIEVIDVSQRLPEEFGYASFVINVVNPIRVSVFTTVDNKINLTTAKAYLLKGTDTIKSYTLGATVNLISFKGDPDANYKLLVVKEGYNLCSKEFVYSELMAMLGNLPLKIYLVPATFTMLAFVDDVRKEFEVTVSGSPGTISVNWGDGSIDTYSMHPQETILNHTYSSSGNFQITVTGDLDKITSFYLFYESGMLDAVNLQGLTELKLIRMGLLLRVPKLIDLSNCTKLEDVMITGTPQLENLILPVENFIRFIIIDGPNMLTTASVDDAIDKVYATAVQHHEMNGSFTLRKLWYEQNEVMVGPPSAAAMTKLRELRDIYQWTIVPDPF